MPLHPIYSDAASMSICFLLVRAHPPCSQMSLICTYPSVQFWRLTCFVWWEISTSVHPPTIGSYSSVALSEYCILMFVRHFALQNVAPCLLHTLGTYIFIFDRKLESVSASFSNPYRNSGDVCLRLPSRDPTLKPRNSSSYATFVRW